MDWRITQIQLNWNSTSSSGWRLLRTLSGVLTPWARLHHTDFLYFDTLSTLCRRKRGVCVCAVVWKQQTTGCSHFYLVIAGVQMLGGLVNPEVLLHLCSTQAAGRFVLFHLQLYSIINFSIRFLLFHFSQELFKCYPHSVTHLGKTTLTHISPEIYCKSGGSDL